MVATPDEAASGPFHPLGRGRRGPSFTTALLLVIVYVNRLVYERTQVRWACAGHEPVVYCLIQSPIERTSESRVIPPRLYG